MSFPKESSNIGDDIFSLSFVNHSMELLMDDSPELLSSNTSVHDDENDDEDFAMTYHINNSTIITPNANSNFIAGEYYNENKKTSNELETTDNNINNNNNNNNNVNPFNPNASYERIIDSYSNVAQQNYELWLSSS